MKRLIILLIIILIVIFGWTGTWIYASNRLKDETLAFFERSSQSPQQINCEKFDVAGFPFRFDITCTNFTITETDVALSIPELKASLLVYRPTHLLLFAAGPAKMIDSFSGSRRQLSWDTLSASLRTNGWSLARFSIQANNLSVMDLLIGETLIARIEHFEAHLVAAENQPEEQANLSTVLAFAKIENASAPEFDVQNAKVELDAQITDMPDDLRLWTPAIIADSWHQNQSGITIQKLAGLDDRSSFSINGNITTTAQAMLSGNLDFFSTNLAPRFDQIMDPQSQQVIFGQQSDDGSNYQSYSLVHGVFLAGNLPILTFGPMR